MIPRMIPPSEVIVMKRKLLILPLVAVLLLSVLCICCYQMLNVPDCAMQVYKLRALYDDKWYVIYEIIDNKLKCTVGDANCAFSKDYKTGKIISSYDHVIWEDERRLTLKERISLAKKLKTISKKEVYKGDMDNGISVEFLLNNEVSMSQLAVLDWDSPEFHHACADEDVIRLFGDFAMLIKPKLPTTPEKRKSAEELFAWVYKFDGKIVPTTKTYNKFTYSDFTVNYW